VAIVSLLLVACAPEDAGFVAGDLCEGWKVRAGDAAAYAEPEFDDSSWATRRLDARWSRDVDARDASVMWLRRRVPPEMLPADAMTVDVVLGPVESAYELYANGVLVGHNGHIDGGIRRGSLTARAYSLPAPRGGEALLLALRVGREERMLRTTFTSGPLAGPCVLAPPDSGETLARLSRATALAQHFPALIAFAAFVIVALQQLALFWKGRELREHLWFSVLATSMAVDSLVVFQQATAHADLPSYWVARAAVLVASTSGFAALRFFGALFQVRHRGMRVVEAALALAVVVPPTGILTSLVLLPDVLHRALVYARDAAIVLAVAICFVIMSTRLLRGNREARTIAVGTVTCFVTVVYVRLAYQGLVPMFPGFASLTHAGFVAAVLSVAIALANRYSRMLQGLTERTREVEARAVEVERLNQELRRQVADRSRDLATVLQRTVGSMGRAAIRIGDRVGDRYRVTRELGAGGMGSVYQVERTTDGARFALKVMQGIASGHAAARFARESEIAAQLVHPNLVPVVDVGFGTWGGPYLVMELVDGRTLDELRDRFGDARFAQEVLAGVARGLHELHRRGILHRDLKPANVLVTESDGFSARISDYGIAKLDDDSLCFADTLAPGEAQGTVDPLGTTAPPMAPRASGKLTATGALLGTPRYMAPELATGARATTASDVYAFGVIGWEVLTGTYPFVETPIVLAQRGLPAPAPPSVDARAPELLVLMAECMCPEPDRRPDAEAVAQRIDASFAAGRGVGARVGA
jgi:hypothetical protein